MSGLEFAQSLPRPLCVASVVLCIAAMVLLSLGSHGKIRNGWGGLVLGCSAFCLVLALIVGWTTAGAVA